MNTSYLKLPKALINSSKYSDLSLNAAVLYSLLCDRLELSVKNGMFDKSGRPFVIFTREEAAKTLHISDRTAKTVFNQLSEYGLITEKRQGNCRPNRIYPSEIQNIKNFGSCSENFTVQEPKESGSINTDNNKTDNINTEKTLSVCRSECAHEKALEEIFEKIDFSAVLPETETMLKTVITRMFYSNRIKNGNEVLPQNEIRNLLYRLNTDHIIEVESRIIGECSDTTNPSAFIMAMLINIITSEDIETVYVKTQKKRRQNCRL